MRESNVRRKLGKSLNRPQKYDSFGREFRLVRDEVGYMYGCSVRKPESGNLLNAVQRNGNVEGLERKGEDSAKEAIDSGMMRGAISSLAETKLDGSTSNAVLEGGSVQQRVPDAVLREHAKQKPTYGVMQSSLSPDMSRPRPLSYFDIPIIGFTAPYQLTCHPSTLKAYGLTEDQMGRLKKPAVPKQRVVGETRMNVQELAKMLLTSSDNLDSILECVDVDDNDELMVEEPSSKLLSALPEELLFNEELSLIDQEEIEAGFASNRSLKRSTTEEEQWIPAHEFFQGRERSGGEGKGVRKATARNASPMHSILQNGSKHLKAIRVQPGVISEGEDLYESDYEMEEDEDEFNPLQRLLEDMDVNSDHEEGLGRTVEAGAHKSTNVGGESALVNYQDLFKHKDARKLSQSSQDKYYSSSKHVTKSIMLETFDDMEVEVDIVEEEIVEVMEEELEPITQSTEAYHSSSDTSANASRGEEKKEAPNTSLLAASGDWYESGDMSAEGSDDGSEGRNSSGKSSRSGKKPSLLRRAFSVQHRRGNSTPTFQSFKTELRPPGSPSSPSSPASPGSPLSRSPQARSPQAAAGSPSASLLTKKPLGRARISRVFEETLTNDAMVNVLQDGILEVCEGEAIQRSVGTPNLFKRDAKASAHVEAKPLKDTKLESPPTKDADSEEALPASGMNKSSKGATVEGTSGCRSRLDSRPKSRQASAPRSTPGTPIEDPRPQRLPAHVRPSSRLKIASSHPARTRSPSPLRTRSVQNLRKKFESKPTQGDYHRGVCGTRNGDGAADVTRDRITTFTDMTGEPDI